jgi:hypothetical protein
MPMPHRRFANRPRVALLALLAVVSGCGPNPNSPSSITGTWVGTVVSASLGTGSTQLTLVQSGSSITGTVVNTFPGTTSSASGQLTGTLNGSAFTAALAASNGCIRTWTGTWSGRTLSGAIATTSGCATVDTGTFTVTLE